MIPFKQIEKCAQKNVLCAHSFVQSFVVIEKHLCYEGENFFADLKKYEGVGSAQHKKERRMEIKVVKADPSALKPKPADESQLGFGDIYTDHMFSMDFESGKGWLDPRIEPYGDLHIDPAAMALHYGQEIFEGLKGYRGKDGSLYLFRATDNFKRMNRSAVRLCMPEVDIDLVMEGLKRLIILDQDWVPRSEGTSLYIRPTMLATEPHLGVRPSNNYLFFIIIGPVGAYYKEGLNPVKIYVENKYVRAAIGGTGEAKTAGNYAGSLLAAEEAKEKGFTQVLWLDAAERKYVEEVGTMNMFFIIDDEAITAPLTGSILPGVTRDSVIQIFRDWGVKVSERNLSIDEVIEAAKKGSLKEAFGTGTAAVISPVGQITYKGEDHIVAGGKMGELSQKLYDEIVGIQYGTKEDRHGWVERIN
jgi:branched-chain amino acid aminotransferase